MYLPWRIAGHLFIICPLFYLQGFVSKHSTKTGPDKDRMDNMWVSFLTGGSSNSSLLAEPTSAAYLHILKPSCNIASVFCWCLLLLSPIFCLIVIHVQSVCLANLLIFRPSQPSCSTPACHRVRFMLPFCIFCLAVMIHSLCQGGCRTSLQACGFHSSLRCKTA